MAAIPPTAESQLPPDRIFANAAARGVSLVETI